MLDSIYIGMTGLMGYSRGLRVIANNTANLNTPGFKGSTLQFGDLFYAPGPAGGGLNEAATRLGQGLNTYATTFDFSQGELRRTGNDLDLAVEGNGLFTLRNDAGDVVYTRDGEFSFDAEGVLVSRTTGAKVLGRDADGATVEITLDGKRSSPAQKTTTVTFRGNLDSGEDDASLSDVSVIDAAGGKHLLGVKLVNQGSVQPGQWKVTLLDGAVEVGNGTLRFVDGQLAAGTGKISLSYRPAGTSEIPLVLDFSRDVTSFAAGDNSTLAVVKTDGVAAGALTGATFAEDGTLTLSYSNGEKDKGPRLALARFESTDAVAAAGDNTFTASSEGPWEFGVAQQGGFGSVRSGVVEISNVDLSSEFSDLVIMQRGYQASSQVVSTANDMLQELFSLKGR